MNRRDLIRNALLSAGALSSRNALAQQEDAVPKAHHSYPAPPKRTDGSPMPNILWVCTDQQRFDTIEGLSNSVIHTPNLARFAREAVTFTNVFVQTPICSPSRGSLLTGRYPHCTGLRANGQRIRPTERLVTRILADYEYTCGLAGKLHLSPCFGGRIEDRIDDGYEVFQWSHDITDTWPGHNEWRNWLDRQGVKLPKFPQQHVWGMPIMPKYSQTAWCGEMAIQFMRQQKNFSPWLFSCNIFQPHHPFFPTEEVLAKYDPAKMPDPAYREGELQNKPLFQSIDHEGAYGGSAISFTKTSPEEHRRVIAAYYAMIEQADLAFGEMLQALDESGQADNTIVIFMSDHGEMLGDHGLYLKGPYFYDCLTRVPLMIRWPERYKGGTKVDTLVELIDLAPTLLEAAGIPIPSAMQGRSLTRLLTGETKEHRESVYTEFLDANASYAIPPMLTSVRTSRYKLSLCDKPRAGELYDLEKDPGEFNNVWGDPHYRDTREMMLELLVARMIEASDPNPERHAPW
jgi:arylsulfatase A-like enzyme